MDILDMIAAAPRVFMSITIPDVIDIILLTLLLIAVIRFMSETRATQLLKGIGLIALLYLLVWLGQLKVMTYLFQNFFLQWGLVAIVVVFQPEIRRLLEKVGTTAKVRIPFLAYFEKADAQKVIERDTAITAISDACERLSRTKTGALIVIERQTKLQNIIEKSTDHIVLMKDGHIMQQGTPNDLYAHPNSLFVASFVGTPQINKLTCKVVEKGGSLAFQCGELLLSVPDDLTALMQQYKSKEHSSPNAFVPSTSSGSM